LARQDNGLAEHFNLKLALGAEVEQPAGELCEGRIDLGGAVLLWLWMGH